MSPLQTRLSVIETIECFYAVARSDRIKRLSRAVAWCEWIEELDLRAFDFSKAVCFDGAIVGRSVQNIGKDALTGISKIYFRGNGPSVYSADNSDHSFDLSAVLYCRNGKTGWTSGSKWNGYNISSYNADDLNGDNNETITDAAYLLWNIPGKSGYELPVYSYCDYNGDGAVNASDAVYLLWHMFYPNEYPA